MYEFIHTFSATTHLFENEKDALTGAYHDKIFYNGKEEKLVLHKYVENGLRIEIKFNTKAEKKYDKKHREHKVELIITPAKLLYPGEVMKKIYAAEEYKLAFEKLVAILEEIKAVSGVSLWNETKIQRVDITKDIETESDEYSKEIIRLAKLALHKTGYHLWRPTQEEVDKTGWAEDDSTMFYNHNQEVSTKIYNKLTDLKNQNYDTTDIKGLLRFELTLKRNFLKNHGLIKSGNNTFDELNELFSIVIDNAEGLMQTHVVGPMWNGNFLSKKLQRKYIKLRYGKNSSEYKKMLKHLDSCEKGIVIESGKVTDYFNKIELSPLHTSKEFSYIPSFTCLISNTENEEIKRFAERQLSKIQ